jgi:hypothetical protein
MGARRSKIRQARKVLEHSKIGSAKATSMMDSGIKLCKSKSVKSSGCHCDEAYERTLGTDIMY